MRLIDADALKKDLTRFYDNEVTAKQLIDEQPTIRQDPCGDAISRAKVLSHAKTEWGNGHEQPFDYVEVDVIKQLPPVTPTEKVGQWIPVSERLPEEETDVLVCNANGDIGLSRGSYSTEMKNEFIWYTSGWRFGKVVAWMPLPESYKASPTRAERSEE